jgi:hypothetical protein
MDKRLEDASQRIRRFSSGIWAEALRDFRLGGIELRTSASTGEVGLTAAERPVITGLERNVINMVLSDHIPMFWDNGRSVAGVTTLYEGYHVCVIALRYAHGNQVPFVAVNTCVHELLHALLEDIFAGPPKWYQAGGRIPGRLVRDPAVAVSRWRSRAEISRGLSPPSARRCYSHVKCQRLNVNYEHQQFIASLHTGL